MPATKEATTTADNLISSQWTAGDRLAVVDIIAGEMEDGETGTGARLLYWADRLHFLVVAPAEFLEANRQAIVSGFPKGSPSDHNL